MMPVSSSLPRQCLTKVSSLPPRREVTQLKNQVVYANRTDVISNPTEFPDSTDPAFGIKEVQEPVVKASIIVPQGQPYPFNSSAGIETEPDRVFGQHYGALLLS